MVEIEVTAGSGESARGHRRSIDWVDGAVVIIDQCALPHAYRRLRLETVEDVVTAITRLAVRGAPAIGVAGALGVALSARRHAKSPLGHEAVLRDADRLIAARPTAVNLAWGVRRALDRLPAGPKEVLAEARGMLDEDEQVNLAAARRAADLLLELCRRRLLTIATHCNTGRLATVAEGTALGAIKCLARRDRLDSVLVGETRPLMQGARLTTWELAEAGISHRLCVDSALPAAIARGMVDCVVVGADRVAANGDVANKIGTYSLALATAHAGIPFVVVAPESSIDRSIADGRLIMIEERADSEVAELAGQPIAPAGTAVYNPAFDVTPAELVTAVVSEVAMYDGPIATGPQTGCDDELSRAHPARCWSGQPGDGDHDRGDDLRDSSRADRARWPSPAPVGARAGGALAVSGDEARQRLDVDAQAAELVAAARDLYRRGWMEGTSGNASVRSGPGHVLITASGRSKGGLTSDDTVLVGLPDGAPAQPSSRRPSAETAIHVALYECLPGCGAIVHAHGPYATAFACGAAEPPNVALARIAGYELLKGLGLADPRVAHIPVFPNWADVSRIAADVARHFTGAAGAGPPVLLIADHGATVWGANIEEACNRLECLEALCQLDLLTSLAKSARPRAPDADGNVG